MRLPVSLVLLSGLTAALASCGGSGPTPTPSGTPHKLPNPIHSVIPVPTPTPAGTPASGSPSSYLTTWPLPPLCPLTAAGAPICVAPFAGGNRQAPGGASILFRIGWGAATQQDCDAYASSTTIRITVDGQPENFITVPCAFFALSPFPSGGTANTWVTDARYLSPPLPPGPHTASATITYHATISDGFTGTIASGTVTPFSVTVTVG